MNLRRTLAAASFFLGAGAAPALSADSAVILTYYRFGEEAQAATNIKLAEFDAHLKELTSGRYHVLPLPEILSAIREKRSLPDRAVAITLDDGFASAYAHAWPRLRAAKLPFTVFVTTGPIDAKAKGIMSWDQLRELAKAGVTIGAQTRTHLHMIEASDERNREEMAASNKRIADEIGTAPIVFSYPYGEASARTMALAKQAGYRFALGQFSGVANPTMDDFHVPRFGVNESSGDFARFKLILNALPLRVADVSPADPLVTGANPPAFGFTVTGDLARVAAIRCFASSEGRVRIERLGAERIEVRLAKPLAPGRTRLNCTMPGPDGRWHWYGTSFYVPKPDAARTAPQ